jgi:RNA recognition motif-containing protein
MLQGGRCKGYGFVCFSTADEATEAIAAMNGQQLGLKIIYVALSKGQAARPNPSNHRYPSRTTVPGYSNMFHTPTHQFQTSWNGQVPFMTRISTRLPSRIYSTFNDHQSPLHSREKSKITPQLSSYFNQSIQSNINAISSDEDEEN